jgi:hypothetical protein
MCNRSAAPRLCHFQRICHFQNFSFPEFFILSAAKNLLLAFLSVILGEAEDLLFKGFERARL